MRVIGQEWATDAAATASGTQTSFTLPDDCPICNAKHTTCTGDVNHE